MALYRCVDCQRYVEVEVTLEDPTCTVCGGLVHGALEHSSETSWLDVYREQMERDVADAAARRRRKGRRRGMWGLFTRSRKD